MEFMVNCYNKSDHKLSWEGKMMKTIRKTAIVMLLFVYFSDLWCAAAGVGSR